MKILFLTRKYPPSVGGMENQSYNLIKHFKKINKDTFVVANKYGNKFLPIFIPYSFFKSLHLIKKNKITHLHLGDGLLALEGYLIKKLTNIKTAITIHGLDITYKNKVYQKFIPKYVNKLDKIICVSNFTKNECLKRNIISKKCVVIPNGINPDQFIIKKSKRELRNKLAEKLNLNLEDKKILLSVGRLIKRKGIGWFVADVVPNLEDRFLYLVCGDGPERIDIKNFVIKNELVNKVTLLGKVDFETLKLLYNCADFFIMPNIKVDGDIEGFGIVALEAASCGVPVVASNIDGIKDAVYEGKTGLLINERDINSFLRVLKSKSLNKQKVICTIKNNFNWKDIAKKYYYKLK